MNGHTWQVSNAVARAAALPSCSSLSQVELSAMLLNLKIFCSQTAHLAASSIGFSG